MTRIGDLRHRVTLQSRTDTADGRKGFTTTWATLAVVWAAVESISGREALIAGQMNAALTTTVTIRHRSDISVKQRILFGARTLQIENYQDPDGRKVWTKMLCSEVQA